MVPISHGTDLFSTVASLSHAVQTYSVRYGTEYISYGINSFGTVPSLYKPLGIIHVLSNPY